MSQWTRVHASIWLTGFPKDTSPKSPRFTLNLGPICYETIDSPGKVGPPELGSEGGLNFLIHRQPDNNNHIDCLLSFWGNLRDVGSEGDIAELVAYFNNVTIGQMVNSALLEFLTDNQPVQGYRYSLTEKVFILNTQNPNN